MKLIAHRGNIDGPNSSKENHPEYIEAAIADGYDVEIDLRYDKVTETLWLGHDEPKYQVTAWWLAKRCSNLWIHCKSLDTLHEMSVNTSGYNYFWHQEDDYTLTSKNFIWTYPGKEYKSKSVIVMPEWDNMSYDALRNVECYGICSDYVGMLK
jgi:hypothetical protein